MTTKELRAATFSRVSTDTQAEKGKASLPSQKSTTRSYVEEVLGGTVVGEFTEEGVSGNLKLMQRPEVLRLLAMAASGEIDVVVFNERDRVARDYTEARNLYDQLRDLDVTLHTVEGGERDYDKNLITEGIHDIISEHERSTTAKRTTRGRYAKACEGKWVGGGRTPYGYKRNEDKYLVTDPDAVEVVRFAYARAIAGDNLAEVTRRLNARYPHFIGQKEAIGFSTGTVRRWLTKPGYKGDGFVQMVKPGTRSKPEEFKCMAPAIVTREEWGDANASLEASRGKWRESQNRRVDRMQDLDKYALNKRVFHVHENGPVGTTALTRTDSDVRAYQCSHAKPSYKVRWKERDGFDPCAGWGLHPRNKALRRTSVRASDIEARTLLLIVKALRSPEAIAELRASEDRRALAVDESTDILSAAYDERAVLEHEAEVIIRQERRGRISEAEAEEALADLDARRLISVERVARLEAEVEDLEGFAATIEEILHGSVTILGISPGDETEFDISEEGEEFVVVPGWDDIVSKLTSEANAVLAGESEDLVQTTVDWLKYMVVRFGVRVFVENGDGSDFAYRIKADKGRLFGDNGHVLTVNQNRRLRIRTG